MNEFSLGDEFLDALPTCPARGWGHFLPVQEQVCQTKSDMSRIAFQFFCGRSVFLVSGWQAPTFSPLQAFLEGVERHASPRQGTKAFLCFDRALPLPFVSSFFFPSIIPLVASSLFPLESSLEFMARGSAVPSTISRAGPASPSPFYWAIKSAGMATHRHAIFRSRFRPCRFIRSRFREPQKTSLKRPLIPRAASQVRCSITSAPAFHPSAQRSCSGSLLR